MTEYFLYNILQMLVVLLFAPLMTGISAWLKERVQSHRGPSILQPYFDLWKLFHKDEIVSQESTWIFRATPYVLFVTPLIVALLIPVLTDYPLFFAFMGDMLAGGFILALGGFFAALAAIDTANPYGPMGASRTRMVGFLAEPVFIIVFFTVSIVAGSTIPYIVQQRWVHPSAEFFDPAHILLMIAFFMLILAETGRLPVDNPSGHFELAMIDESKGLEYSGRGAALVKWGGAMKFFVLLCIFLNVLVAPWGLATTRNPVVFAMSTAYMAVVMVLLLAGLYGAVRWATRKRKVHRGLVWDGGVRRLFPDMTYTATGFSNPVRVVFQAIFRPVAEEDARTRVGGHFRSALTRSQREPFAMDRLFLYPLVRAVRRAATLAARPHHSGRVNLYAATVLLTLLLVLILNLVRP